MLINHQQMEDIKKTVNMAMISSNESLAFRVYKLVDLFT